MTMLVYDTSEPVAPTAADAILARESARRLAPVLTKTRDTMELRVATDEGAIESVVIPTAAFRLFIRVLAEMASGNAVRLIPHHAELTTQEAAELLNISRPYIVRLIDDGVIPSYRV